MLSSLSMESGIRTFFHHGLNKVLVCVKIMWSMMTHLKNTKKYNSQKHNKQDGDAGLNNKAYNDVNS